MPVSASAISNGAVWIRGGRVKAVGPWRELRARSPKRVLDLGEVILLPGLVNAHCHLDYTEMAGQLPPPQSFTQWLQSIVSIKAGWHLGDYRSSWRRGAEMLLRTGTTTVGDIEAIPELLPELWEQTPLRIVSLLEMIGITNRRSAAEILAETLSKANKLRGHRRCRTGLSPHAPYSTTSELLERTARAVRKPLRVVCVHLAESQSEFAMFARGCGEMFEWLGRSGREMADCGRGSPVQHLERCGLLGRWLLAAHVNYLGRGDAALLARRGVSVVHCPRSHFYFGHQRCPLGPLSRAGVNLCLGTDSLATVYRSRGEAVALDMFAEMRALAEREPGLSCKRILEMATINGARALHQWPAIGRLGPGASADLIAIPFTGRFSTAGDAVLAHKGPVVASMIDGCWALPPSAMREQA